jgi:hypothetical protein
MIIDKEDLAAIKVILSLLLPDFVVAYINNKFNANLG